MPFDIYTAVRSLNAASHATGKEAIDHYVSAGLSITSAAMTVILGTAAMAGLPFVGPAGLLAGACLAIGSQVYGAVRVVEDIDEYIELTLGERWRSGFFTFCMMDVEQGVKDRYNQAKTLIQHSQQLKHKARRLLDADLKDTTEAVVNGAFAVDLVATRVRRRNWWTKVDSWEMENVPVVRGQMTRSTPVMASPRTHPAQSWALPETTRASCGLSAMAVIRSKALRRNPTFSITAREPRT
ncbi:hypothetical protein [Pseudomonas sp. S11A4]|uniref:hypothetical protein n=1 Tax=Pseudomonas sp. S11A4 TaxID=1476791 RepID=UPI00215C148E|nr:hypothetical protein [Pseudomonas sp. S11A4]MCR8932179.1 hypothetical protein [Pseudomonas sp. S11A4]